MRIVAGTHRGRRIPSPRGLDVRPTADRVREALFSIIGPVEGARVADLFAGTGALGMEALSRGAASCVFVESRRAAADAIAAALHGLGLTGGRVLCRDVRRLRPDDLGPDRYDLVLVDPPYSIFDSMQEQLSTLVPALLAPGGLAVVETEARIEPHLGLPLRVTRRYGGTRVTLLDAP